MAVTISEPEHLGVPQRTRETPCAARATRILVVEDDPLTAEVFAMALVRAGHFVDIARDGRQALRHMRERAPSLVVLDMSLPAISGAAVVRELRASGCSDLPVVVVSGSERSATTLTDSELWPGTWLTKPVKPRRLVEIVRDMLGDR